MISLCLLFFFGGATIQSAHAQEAKGVVFKIPDDVFPIDWKKSGFKGILMLRKDSPSGIFVCYPNEGETIDALKQRAVKFIAPMFVSDEEEKKAIGFQTFPIPNHTGDAADAAAYYAYTGEKNAVQILVYDRAVKGNNLIYGYFAMKDKTAKPESVKNLWADDQGRGVKFFDKFWKTIKE